MKDKLHKAIEQFIEFGSSNHTIQLNESVFIDLELRGLCMVEITLYSESISESQLYRFKEFEEWNNYGEFVLNSFKHQLIHLVDEANSIINLIKG